MAILIMHIYFYCFEDVGEKSLPGAAEVSENHSEENIGIVCEKNLNFCIIKQKIDILCNKK